MAIFSSAKSFLSVVLRDNSCKFHYRKLNGKKITDEKTDEFIFTEDSELAATLTKFIDLNEKRLTSTVLIDDKTQNVVFEMVNEDGIICQEVDKDFFVCFSQNLVDRANELFGIKFDSCISLFRVLYILITNQHFAETAMYALKFSDKIAFLVADKDKVSYANIVSTKDSFIDDSDPDEMFFEILKDEIDKFYADHKSDFINNIFIYSDGSLGNEIGYVIFSRIFVKTNLIYVDFADFINKIAIKESIKRH
ncbi:MAG: hypothetical protein J6W17_01330 [Campylobacter sp.]|nr:hypothetical protein [Campylobacter sp.]